MTKSYPDNSDGDALRRVVNGGNDMSKPMLIEFELDTPTEDIANLCVQRLSSKDFVSQKSHDKSLNRWTVTIPVIMVPDYEEIVYFQKVLDEDLNPLGARTDGWGTLGNIPENLPADILKAISS